MNNESKCCDLSGNPAEIRVRSTTDYALAGRSLPLVMVITATFATWFGSETVLGLPGQFIKNGLEGVFEEPFGSSMALILVGCTTNSCRGKETDSDRAEQI